MYSSNKKTDNFPKKALAINGTNLKYCSIRHLRNQNKMYNKGYHLSLNSSRIFSLSFFAVLFLLLQYVLIQYDGASSDVQFIQSHARRLTEQNENQEELDPILKHYIESAEREEIKWLKEKNYREQRDKDLDEYTKKAKAEVEKLTEMLDDLLKWLKENTEDDNEDNSNQNESKNEESDGEES